MAEIIRYDKNETFDNKGKVISAETVPVYEKDLPPMTTGELTDKVKDLEVRLAILEAK